MEKKSKILVTGATGLLGANLTRRLVSDGYSVRIFNKDLSKHPFLENLAVEVFKGDIINTGEVNSAVADVDYIFHCAGVISYFKKDKNLIFKVNADGTKNILSAALKYKVKKVIHISSVSAFEAIGDYGKSKKASEALCEEYIKQGLNVVIARPATIYGAGDIKGNSIRPFKQVLSSKFVFVPPGGKSYIHISDLVDGLLLLMENGKTGLKYTFSSEDLSFNQLYELIAKVFKKKIKLWL